MNERNVQLWNVDRGDELTYIFYTGKLRVRLSQYRMFQL